MELIILSAGLFLCMILLVFFIGLWQRNLRNEVKLTNLIIHMFLNEDVYKHERDICLDFVATSKARSPDLLMLSVSYGLIEIGGRYMPSTVGANRTFLWNLKLRLTN